MFDDRPALRQAANPPGRAAQYESDCFADEVAVDFPSVAPLVARMRRAFLEHETTPHPVWAEVSLTVREAASGCRKPVDVSLRWVCSRCGGRGETWAERCSGCSGTGASTALQVVYVSVPAGVRDGARLAMQVAPPNASATVVHVRVSVARGRL
jgi:hypothetical protein